MSLAKVAAPAFLYTIRSRGQVYFDLDYVKVLDHNETLAKFRVTGTDDYKVSLQLDAAKKIMLAKCDCPYYEDGDLCKHLWAVILKSDEQGLLPAAAEVKDLEFLHDQDPSKDDDPLVSSPVLPSRGDWRDQILQAQTVPTVESKTVAPRFENAKQAFFAMDLATSQRLKKINLRFFIREILRGGDLTSFRPTELNQDSIRHFPNEFDRKILWTLLGQTELNSENSTSFGFWRGASSVSINSEAAEKILGLISDAQKLVLLASPKGLVRNEKFVLEPYEFKSQPWFFHLVLNKIDQSYYLQGSFSDGVSRQAIWDVLGFVNKFILFEKFMVVCDLKACQGWYEVLKKNRQIEIPEDELNAFLTLYFKDQSGPELTLPPEVQFTDQHEVVPAVRLSFSSVKDSSLLQAHLEFIYDDLAVRRNSPSTVLYKIEQRQRVHRNFEREQQIFLQFSTLVTDKDLIHRFSDLEADAVFHEKSFLQAVEAALNFGWSVVAHQKRISTGRDFKIQVTTDTDWFDVKAQFEFGDVTITLPELLQHLKLRQKFISLGDGTIGLLPEEWLKKFGPLAEVAQKSDKGLRLNKVQALFLSASLGDDHRLEADKKFVTLKNFIDTLKQADSSLTPPPEFKGKLRHYQKVGLGWLNQLSQQELGGILADDMGLGKTVQILALLTMNSKKPKSPTLIVAPKTLIFNWEQEIRRFTPQLKVLNYTGINRRAQLSHLKDYDVMLTTYSSLRADIEWLKDVQFNFFILDEAHMVKNPQSQGAMACRLVHAKRRLALTGTPVENSLTDLFSILSIVIPGLVSETQALRWAKQRDDEALQNLSRSLTPFLLRRTKDQVLQDLPKKTEQVLYCQLSAAEKKKYNELKNFYWSQLGGKIEEKGFANSKMEILEALLRLRQAACHQGLLNKDLKRQMSTKFELLLEQVEAVIQDGHKALVFSQFTSLLELLKFHLNERNIAFEYLDGQTKNRQERVENFQNNSDVKLFLLSLKAGGVGLNLTAAEYVFILDPWWNPAAEAQAVDRTHRIGQTKRVFAYKIIAKDTVEEKILELQKTKKALAQAVIGNEKGVLRDLKFQDLQMLFE